MTGHERSKPISRNTGRPVGEAADLCHHLASRRRQDHADRAIAAVGRRDPSGGSGQGPRRGAPRPLRLDEDRAGTRHFGHDRGDDLRVRRHGVQSARHAGPRRFLRGYLPHADGGRFRGDGDRRGEGHRSPDAEIVRGLPSARHSDHHLHQQDGPGGARSVRAGRRNRRSAAARMRADELAGGFGAQFPRRAGFHDERIRAVRGAERKGGGAAR